MAVAAGTIALKGFFLMVLSDNDGNVASSKQHTSFKARVQKLYPISNQNIMAKING